MRKALMISAAAFLIYCAVCMSLALPYRLFPSDDDYFRSTIAESDGRSLLSTIAHSHHPVLLASLKGVAGFWSFFSKEVSSALAFHAIVSNGLALWLMTVFVFFLTGSGWVATVAALVFGSCAWPANYAFFYSYAPFAALLSLLVCFLLTRCFLLSPPLETGKRYMAGAGAAAALFFWSAPSSPVMIALYCLMLVLLFDPLRDGRGRAFLAVFGIAFACVTLPLAVHSLPVLAAHIAENIHQQGLTAAETVRSPSLSMLRILGVYNAPLMYVFLLVSAAYLIVLLKDRKGDAGHRVTAVLLLAVWLHMLAVDWGPSTKLARTHFVIFPVMIVALTSAGYRIFQAVPVHVKRFLAVAVFAALAWIVCVNGAMCRSLVHAKAYTPAWLRSLAASGGGLKIYLLEEDSHADSLAGWLQEDFPVEKIRQSDLAGIDFTHGCLLLGPRGGGSGLSILSNCCLDDFKPKGIEDIPAVKGFARVLLPYYAYFPTLLLEEETCLGFYFRDSRVDYLSDEKQLLLLYPKR